MTEKSSSEFATYDRAKAIAEDVIREDIKACMKGLAHPNLEWSKAVQLAGDFIALVTTRSETLQTEVLTYERDRAQAMYENAMRYLTSIYAFINPPFVTAGGKTYSFQNPDANETLQILSDAIRAIPEDLRSTPSATRTITKDESPPWTNTSKGLPEVGVDVWLILECGSELTHASRQADGDWFWRGLTFNADTGEYWRPMT